MTQKLLAAPAIGPNEKMVIAHIGAHKTATSLVQRYFKDKRAHYAKQGMNFITRSDVSPKISWGDAVIKNPADLNKLLNNRSAKGRGAYTLFSNENALGKPLQSKPGLYPSHKEIIPSLHEAMNGFRPRIVYSVRPPWEFLESYYLQLVHQGYFLTFNQFVKEIDLKALSWTPIVDTLISEFGRENVVVIDFRLIRQGQEVFLSEFLRRAVSANMKPDPDYGKVHNPSISDRGLQLALRMNPLLENNETGVVRRFLQEHFSNRTEPRPNLMAPALKSEMQDRYGDEYNAMIAAG